MLTTRCIWSTEDPLVATNTRCSDDSVDSLHIPRKKTPVHPVDVAVDRCTGCTVMTVPADCCFSSVCLCAVRVSRPSNLSFCIVFCAVLNVVLCFGLEHRCQHCFRHFSSHKQRMLINFQWRPRSRWMKMNAPKFPVSCRPFPRQFNPLKCSGIRWLHLQMFNAIQV